MHKMLVLNSKKKKVPDWLFPECGILDPLKSFTGCAMTSSSPPRLAPHTEAPHGPGMEEPEDYRHPSHSQVLSDSTFINCHSTPLPPEWVTQTARYSQRFWQLSLERLGRAWLDWKTHPLLRDRQESRKSMHLTEKPTLYPQQTVQLTWKLILPVNHRTTKFSKLHVLHAVFNTICYTQEFNRLLSVLKGFNGYSFTFLAQKQ